MTTSEITPGARVEIVSEEFSNDPFLGLMMHLAHGIEKGSKGTVVDLPAFLDADDRETAARLGLVAVEFPADVEDGKISLPILRESLAVLTDESGRD